MIFGQIYEILVTVNRQGQGLGPESVVILSTHLGGMENLGSSEPETEGVLITGKRTDVWSRDFIIWKINSRLWALGSGLVWTGLWKKRVWADYEQLLRPVFSLFFFLKNTVVFALKSCIK